MIVKRQFKHIYHVCLIGLSLVAILCSSSALAQLGPSDLNVSGGLFNPNGTPVLNQHVNFKVEVLDKNAACVLYSEQHNDVDLTATKGAFSLQIGTGASALNNFEGTTTFSKGIFENPGGTSAPFTGCAGGVSLATGNDRLVRISYDIGQTGTFVAMTPEVNITSAPYSMVADTLQGKGPDAFVMTNLNAANSSLTQANVENVFTNANYTELTNLLSGASTQYIKTNPTAAVSFNSQRLINVADPIAAQDASTKNYADSKVGGQVLDMTGVDSTTGAGKTLVWDQTNDKWIAANVGSVSAIATGNGLLGGTITSAGTISVDAGTGANQIVQLDGNAQLPAIDGSQLTNVNATRIAGQDISTATPLSNQILSYNGTSNRWEPIVNPAISALTGDVVATGPGAVTATIQPNAVTSSKINNTGVAANRLLITDPTTGTTVTYATCAIGEVLQWSASGWVCAPVATMLGTSGVAAGTYGNGTQVAQVSVDAQGRVTQLANVNIAFPVVSVAGRTGAVTLNASDIGGLGTAAVKNYGTSAGELVELDGAGRIPASLLPVGTGTITQVVAGTNLLGGGSVGSVTLNVDVGTTANKVIQLNASAQIPAVDGSQLTNVNSTTIQSRPMSANAPNPADIIMWNNTTSTWEPANVPSAPVQSVAGRVGAVVLTVADIGSAAGQYFTYAPNNVACAPNEILKWDNTNTRWICAPDQNAGGTIQSISSGNGLVGGPITVTGTLTVDVGTTANKILQLNGSAQIPAVDGSLLTNVNASFLATRPVSASAPNPGEVLTWNSTLGQWHAEVNVGITDLTGDVTATGPGSAVATISNNAVTSAKINNVGIGVNRLLITDASTGSTVTYATCAPGEQLHWTATGWACWLPNAGSITNITTGNGLLGGTITSTGTISVDVGTTASKIVQLDSSARLPGVDGSQLTNVNASRIGTHTISNSGAVAGQYIGWNSTTSQWEPMATTVGTVTNVATGNGLTGGPISSTGTISVDVGTTSSKILQLTASAQIPAVDGNLITNVNAVKLQSRNVAASAPAAGQALGWNATTSVWEPMSISSGTVTAVTGGAGLLGGTINGIGTLSVDMGTGANQIVQLDSGARLPGVDGSQLTNVNANRIGQHTIATSNPIAGQYIGWNSTTSQWEPMATTVGTVTNVSTGIGLLGGPINSTGTITVDVGTGANKILQLTSGAQIPAVDGNLVTNVNAVKLQSRNISAATPAGGQVLGWNATTSVWEPSSAAAGSVTNVAGGVGVLGGPISSAGTLSVDVGTGANQIVQLDSSARLPGVDGSQVTNVNATRIGTRTITSAAPAAGQYVGWNSTTSQWEPMAVTSGTVMTVTSGNGLLGGTISNNGTLSVDVGTGANKILQLTASAQIPAIDGNLVTNVNAVKLQTRNVSAATPAAGQALVWNATTSAWEPMSVATGTVTIVNSGTGLLGGPINGIGTLSVDVGTGANQIVQLDSSARLPGVDGSQVTNVNATRIGTRTITSAVPAAGQYVGWNSTTSQWEPMAVTSGTVTTVNSGIGLLGGPINGNGTLNVDVGTGANQIIQLNASAQIPAVDGALVTNVNAVKLQSRNLSATAPVSGQVLAWNATTSIWEPASTAMGTLTYVGTGVGLVGGPINSFGTLAVDVGTGANQIVQLNASAGLPALDASLITNVNAVRIGTRTIATTNPAAGQLIGWNSTTSQWEPMTAASGTVTSVATGNGLLGGTINGVGTISADMGTGANQILQLNASAQIPAVDASLVTNVNAMKLQSRNVSAATPAAGQVLAWNGTTSVWEPVAAAVGTVTSVNSGIGLTGGPINNVGTLNVDVGTGANQILQLNANAQIPAVDGSNVTNLNAVRIGTRVIATSAPASGQFVGWNSTTSQWEPMTATSGTVTTVASGVGLTGGPINGIGTLAVDVGTGANQILQLNASAQIPAVDGFLVTNVNAVKLQTRNVASFAPANGQVLGWNATNSDWEPIAVSSGTVSSITGGAGLLGGTINGVGTLAVDVGTGANQILQLNSSAQIPAVDGSLVTNVNANRIGQHNIATFNPAAGQFIGWNSTTSQWEPLAVTTGTVTTVNSGVGLLGGPINGNGTLAVDVGTGASQILQLNASAQIPAVDGFLVTNINATRLQSRNISSAAPVGGQVLGWNSTTSVWEPYSGATGSVTNVATGTGILGGPVSTTGTISVDVGTGANQIVQLNASAGLPAVDGNAVSNVNAVRLQSRNVSAASPAQGQALTWNTTTSQWEPMTVASGTVTQVNSGTGLLGGPISNIGTLSVDVGTGANQILQLDSSALIPAVDGSLLTNINASRIGTRTIASTTPAANQFLGWNATTAQWEPMAGAIGSVTQVNSGTGLTGGPITSIGTLNVDVGTGANQIVQMTSTAQLPAVDAFLLTNVNGVKIQSRAIAANAPINGQVLGWNTSLTQWQPINAATGSVSFVGAGTGLLGGPVTTNGTIRVDVGTGANQILQLTSTSQIPAVDGFLVTNVNAVKLQSRNVAATAPANGQVLAWNTTNNQWQPMPAGAGSVISVLASTGLTGGTITGIGTIKVDVGTGANQIVQLDASARIPAVDGYQLTNVNAFRIGTRIISTAAPANSQSLVWNSTTSVWEPQSLAGTGVTYVGAGVGLLGGPINSIGTLNVDVGTTASKIIQLNASAQIPAVDGSLLTNINATNIQGKFVNALAPTDGQILVYNATTAKYAAVSLSGGATMVGNGNVSLTTTGATGAYVNGGNTFGAAATLGLKDNFALSFITNNQTAMSIQGNGNVGIGTTSAMALLQVGNASTPSADPSLSNINYGVLGMRASNSVLAMGIASTAPGAAWLQSHTSTSGTSLPLLLNPSGGNVGIGTLSPTRQLDVMGTNAGVGMVDIQNTDSTGFSSIDFSNSAGTVSGSVGYANSNTGGALQGKMFLSSGSVDLLLATNSTERMRVTTGGSIGIGTGTPSSILDVYSTGVSSAIVVPRDTQANRPTAAVNGMIRYATDTGKFEGYQAGSWQTLIASGSTQWITLGSNIYYSLGNVGIGTGTPRAALDVYATGTNSAIILPRDTTAGRPVAGINGMIRYNTTTNMMEAYAANSWQNFQTGTISVGNGGTGLTGGTSGGTLYFNSTTSMASSALLTQYAVMVGGGAGGAPSTLGSLGTAGQVLISGGAGVNPSFGALNLAGGASFVTGSLSIANGGTGGTTAPTARAALGVAASGVNSDITSLTNLTTAITVAQGGTGLTSGTTGGIPYYTAPTTIASSGTLTQYGVMIGGGGVSAPTTVPVGTADYLLTSQGAAAPIMAQLNLGTSVALTGALGVNHGGLGITSGTSGGIPYFSGATTIASSAALTVNSLIVNTASGPASIGAGTSGYPLVSQGAGSPPVMQQINLATSAGLVGALTITKGGTGSLNGSLFGTGTLTLAAGAGNNDVIFAPTGTGNTILNGSGIGIGTGSPTSFVHIANTANPVASPGAWANYPMMLQNTDNTVGNGSGIAFTDSNTTNDVGAAIIFKRIGASSQGELQFYTKQSAVSAVAPVQAMVISNQGYVGIGTTTATAPLTVNGEIASEGSLTITGAPATVANNLGWKFGLFGSTYAIGVGANQTAIKTGGWVSVFAANPANDATATLPDTNAQVSFSNTGTGIFKTSLGIGTVTPSAPLQVYSAGPSTAVMLIEGNGAAANTAGYRVRTSSATPAGAYVMYGATDEGSNLEHGSIFVPNAANTGVFEAVTIAKSTGAVGIGSATPRAALDINLSGTLSSAVILPRDTTANRPTSAVNGMLRYATDTQQLEAYVNNQWQNFQVNGYLTGTSETLTGGLTITAGGESLNGGLNNNNGGITNTGTITGIGNAMTGTGAVTIAAGGTAQNVSVLGSTNGSVNLGNANGTGLSVIDGGASTVNYVSIKGSAAGGSPTISTAGADTNIDLTFSTKGTGNVIFANGNVGIGTSAPTQKLEVNGIIKSTSGGFTFPDGTNLTSAGVTSAGTSSAGDLVFAADSGATGNGVMMFATRTTEKMRLQNNGYLAIGTTTASYIIDVKGSNTAAIARYSDGTTTMTENIGRYWDGSAWQTAANWINFDINGTGSFNFSDTVTVTGGGSVGIGTSNPTGALDVEGSANIILNAGQVAIGTTVPVAQLTTIDTTTATSGNAYGQYSRFLVNPASNSTAAVYGQYILADTTGIGANSLTTLRGSYNLAKSGATGAGTVTNLRGSENVAQNSSTGAVTSMHGAYNQATNSTTGAVTNAYGTYSAITNSSTGPITNAYAFYVDVTGTNIANAYGVYINSLGGTTKSYGVYQAAATDSNYFAGNVSIGTSVAGAALQVNQPSTTGIGLILQGGASNTTDHMQWQSSAGAVQGVIDSTGAVGIGTNNPATPLEVVGIIKATSFLSTSDRRLKTNIETIGGLENVLKLRGVRFNWISNGQPDLGTIAQEVEEVFPEAVVTDPRTGFKAVKYQALIAPLIEAAKDLNVKCEMSKKQSDELGVKVAALEKQQVEVKRRIQSLQQEHTDLKSTLKGLDDRLKALEHKKK